MTAADLSHLGQTVRNGLDAITDAVELQAEVDRLRKALQVCEHTVHLVAPAVEDLHAAQQASGAYQTDWQPEWVRDDLPDFEYREETQ